MAAIVLSSKSIAASGNFLPFAYLFASKNAKSQHLSSPKCYTNRYEFVHRVMTEMMTLVLRGDVNGDTASRIVHCVATVSEMMCASVTIVFFTNIIRPNLPSLAKPLDCAPLDDWISRRCTGLKQCFAA